jgi:hypothetical protein
VLGHSGVCRLSWGSSLRRTIQFRAVTAAGAAFCEHFVSIDVVGSTPMATAIAPHVASESLGHAGSPPVGPR